MLVGVGGAGAVQDVRDGRRVVDAGLLALHRALCGERAVVHGDAQGELAAPVGQRALGARQRCRQLPPLDVGDALQVVPDGVERVAEVKLAGAGGVRVDEVAQIKPSVGSCELDRVKQLAVGVSAVMLEIVRVCGCACETRPSAR